MIDFLAVLSANSKTVAHALPSWLPSYVDSNYFSPAILSGTLALCLGSAIRWLSYHYLGRYFTFQLAIKKDHRLITDGPYSIVRHPSYTGAWLVMIGMAISQLGPGSVYMELGLWKNTLTLLAGIFQLALIVYVGLVIDLRVQKEDKALSEQFEVEWKAWAKRVPCRLIPFLY